MPEKDPIQQQKNDIAMKILTLSRNELLISYGYLNSALGSFKYQDTDLIETIGTDGTYIFYNPDFIIDRYQKQPFWFNRAHLHMILHCLYKHPFFVGAENNDDWNLACEIAVDYVLDEFSGKYIPQIRKAEKQNSFTLFEDVSSVMTAQNIYKVLKGMDPLQINRLNELFLFDDHQLWSKPQSPVQSGRSGGGGDQNEDQNDDTDQQDQPGSSGSGGESDDLDQSSSSASSSMNKEQAMEYWKQIGQSINMDLKTFYKNRGDQPGNLVESIELVNRDKHDYADFLSKFAVLREEMKVDLDSFDYIFYTYGLSLYKNLPLIEPLEYREANKIYDFVIAIDTSGSVDSELVKQFLNKTYGILKSKESFHKKINLHIIQCDTVIHEDKLITTEEEFKEYAAKFNALGRGGTDFRPVFRYVNKLIEMKQFQKLKGLLYFTDGWGVFPEKRTIYDTAFIFIKDDHYNEDIPNWAIKVVLDPDDLTQ
jgi:predicted metal-dependent peptidase